MLQLPTRNWHHACDDCDQDRALPIRLPSWWIRSPSTSTRALPRQALDVAWPGQERVLTTDCKRYHWRFRTVVTTMHVGSVLEIAALGSLTHLSLSGYSVRCGPHIQDVLDHLIAPPPSCRAPPPAR